VRRWFIAISGLLAMLPGSAPVQAAWPEKPVTLIVPWVEGGATDLIARSLAGGLARELGQTVRVRNLVGKSGSVGHAAIAAAAPDGYTIGMLTVEIAMLHWQGIAPLTVADFTPLGQVNADPAVVQVRTDVKFRTVPKLLEIARTHPGNLKASGTGQGGIWHIALAGMLQSAGIPPNNIAWVSSQGAVPALQDLAVGGLDIVVCSLRDAMPAIKAGQVTPLAVLDAARAPGLPAVPTWQEAAGTPWSATAWRGIAGPRNLDPAVAARLAAALKAAYDGAEFQTFMTGRGHVALWRDAAAWQAFIAATDADYGRLMQRLGLIKQ
jgi:tripartite-type tricarboxylate transporter receptor subunit TctC